MDYQMCRQLKMKYHELQELPEDVYVFWRAFLQGEGQAAKDAAQRAGNQR